MSAIIIRRELLEHYLRATGWRLGERGWWERRARQVGTFDAMSEFDIDRAVESVASAESCPRSIIAARLGLCAAAEFSYALMREHTLDGSPMGEIIRDRACAYLRMAGVDPARWEATRGSL